MENYRKLLALMEKQKYFFIKLLLILLPLMICNKIPTGQSFDIEVSQLSRRIEANYLYSLHTIQLAFFCISQWEILSSHIVSDSKHFWQRL